jgi:hypothetical protein
MRRFLESEIWTDPKVRQLEPLGKLLLVYLINNDLGHMSGIYVLPEILITSQTGIKQTEFDKQWKALSMLDIAHRDQSTETVWWSTC